MIGRGQNIERTGKRRLEHMSVGVLIVPDRSAANVVDDAVEKARGAHHAGVQQPWLG